jgi:hypothetical protein
MGWLSRKQCSAFAIFRGPVTNCPTTEPMRPNNYFLRTFAPHKYRCAVFGRGLYRLPIFHAFKEKCREAQGLPGKLPLSPKCFGPVAIVPASSKPEPCFARYRESSMFGQWKTTRSAMNVAGKPHGVSNESSAKKMPERVGGVSPASRRFA